MKRNRFAFSETPRELNIECKKMLTQPTVFGLAISICDAAGLISLMRKCRRTDFNSM